MKHIRNIYKSCCKTSRTNFNFNYLDENKGDLKCLHSTVNYLLDEDSNLVLPSFHTDYGVIADEMAQFYKDKIDNIRSVISKNSSSTQYIVGSAQICQTSFLSFDTISFDALSEIVKNDLNNKNCISDPFPTANIKKHLDYFSPILLNIVNASLNSGVFPQDLKHASVSPILKSKNIDTEMHNNFRPVSSLPFLSKVIEKAAQKQLTKYLKENQLIPSLQSAYLSDHSCETALCKVKNDIQKMVSDGKVVVLVQLDLSAAFDTVDHAALIELLQISFGIKGTALKFIKSYLSGRSFSVKIRHVRGKTVLLIYGVPQGSILGPLLFILYISDMPTIVEKYDVSLHSYADDAQLYIGCNPFVDFTSSMTKLSNCVKEIEKWMQSKFLKLNIGKTEVLFIAKPQNHALHNSMEVYIGNKRYSSSAEHNIYSLGTYFDGTLSMNTMILECFKSCMYNLKRIKRIRHCLDEDSRMLIIKTHVLGKIDYCNILLANCSAVSLRKLTKVLHNAIRFIYGLKKYDHITEYMKKAHILPIKYRIMYKTCIFVFKILNGKAPSYLDDFIALRVLPQRELRSNNDFLIAQQTAYENTIQYAMIRNWNCLPYDIRSLTSIDIFKSKLKTFYFEAAFPI